jgi:release factor glutamine methyltransferase
MIDVSDWDNKPPPAHWPDDLPLSQLMSSPFDGSPITIAAMRRQLVRILRTVAEETAATEADRLLGEIVGARPTELTLRHSEELSPERLRRLESLANDRLTGRPLAHVLGHVEFYGLDMLCDARVLIPRPETETVVDVALRHLPPRQAGHRLRVVDVGTGSGNIAVALAHARSDITVTAIDSQPDALEIAQANSSRYDLDSRIEFIVGNGLDPVCEDHTVDLIVSNPPYIACGDTAIERSVVDYEPHTALFAGESGTEIIEWLLRSAPGRLRLAGAFICEIGFDQAGTVAEIVAASREWGVPGFHKDLAGIDRVLSVQRRG